MGITDRIAELTRHQEALIAEHGWMVQGVFQTAETQSQPAFAYTIGLHAKGLPEMLTIGLPPEAGHQLLNDIARIFLEAQAAQQAEPTGLMSHPRWPMPFYLLAAAAEDVSDWATGAVNRSQGLARFCQICWPDKAGRFPWEVTFSKKFLKIQPILARPPRPVH